MSAATDKPLGFRRFVTPEGVNLGVRLADVSTRFGALTLDLLIMAAIVIVASLSIGAGARAAGGETSAILWILMFFFVRNFYFMAFEMGPRAATPAKRMLGIRVASRRGAHLTTSAVFARNAMREIELFIPILVLFFGDAVTGGRGETVDGWIWLAMAVWVLVFALFPLFNRDRLRMGDLIAGTWVVRSPKPELLPDLSETESARSGQYAFTPAQLGAYGVKELHVLEDVLRRRDADIMREVAERIAAKIGWTVTAGQTSEEFLRAYYAGLRGQLESGLLMGRRRADKFDEVG